MNANGETGTEPFWMLRNSLFAYIRVYSRLKLVFPFPFQMRSERRARQPDGKAASTDSPSRNFRVWIFKPPRRNELSRAGNFATSPFCGRIIGQIAGHQKVRLGRQGDSEKRLVIDIWEVQFPLVLRVNR